VSAALTHEFFARSVHEVSRDLIGCTLLFEEVGGVIVETEAYDASDPACHAFNGPTPRNEPLFGPPGLAYVYLSYGVHQLLNAVAEPEGSASAALIRALEPTHGLEAMRKRRRVEDPRQLCSGPGKLTEALGVGAAQNGADLCAPPFELREPEGEWVGGAVDTDLRIGITKGAELPWRYCAADNRYLSRPIAARLRRQVAATSRRRT
jgi:DNA-3-methyladenine glycosylase